LYHSLGRAHEAADRWQDALNQYQFGVSKDLFVRQLQMSMARPLTWRQRLTSWSCARAEKLFVPSLVIALLASKRLVEGLKYFWN
jgi:hypothetical protein